MYVPDAEHVCADEIYLGSQILIFLGPKWSKICVTYISRRIFVHLMNPHEIQFSPLEETRGGIAVGVEKAEFRGLDWNRGFGLFFSGRVGQCFNLRFWRVESPKDDWVGWAVPADIYSWF